MLENQTAIKNYNYPQKLLLFERRIMVYLQIIIDEIKIIKIKMEFFKISAIVLFVAVFGFSNSNNILTNLSL